MLNLETKGLETVILQRLVSNADMMSYQAALLWPITMKEKLQEKRKE